MAGNSIGSWPRVSGATLGLMVLAQLGVGFYLNSGYGATPDAAITAMQANRSGGLSSFLQGFHYWGSAWLIVHGFLHLLGLLISGDYLKVPKLGWIGAVALFGSAFGLQITGNLLPFDQHDVQTAVVEGGIASRVPLAGSMAASTMLQGEKFGPQTLSAWHNFHLILLVPLSLGALACAFGLPRGESRKGSRGWLLPLVAFAAVCGLSAGLGAPHGPPATEADYAAFDAKASWYTLPMHGALNAFEQLSPGLGWLGTAVLPGLFGAALLFAPWLGKKRDSLARGLVFGLVISFAAFAGVFGGTPASAWGEQIVPPVDFEKPSGSSKPIDEVAAKAGEALSKQGCVGCHGADLTGGQGAPNLMTAYQRHTEADWYIKFLKSPTSVKPGSTMPAMTHLTEEQLAQLAEYLRKPK